MGMRPTHSIKELDRALTKAREDLKVGPEETVTIPQLEMVIEKSIKTWEIRHFFKKWPARKEVLKVVSSRRCK